MRTKQDTLEQLVGWRRNQRDIRKYVETAVVRTQHTKCRECSKKECDKEVLNGKCLHKKRQISNKDPKSHLKELEKEEPMS